VVYPVGFLLCKIVADPVAGCAVDHYAGTAQFSEPDFEISPVLALEEEAASVHPGDIDQFCGAGQGD